MFPTADVERITKTKCPTGPGDTYVSYSDKQVTLADIRELVGIGAIDEEEAQNSSPTIGEFLEMLQPYEDKVQLIGYVIYPPRDDARVSIEGFTGSGLTAEEALEIYEQFHHADEADKDKKKDGTYSVRFWWD